MAVITVPENVMEVALSSANENCGADAEFCAGAFAKAILAAQQRVLAVVDKYVDPITAADIAAELRRPSLQDSEV